MRSERGKADKIEYTRTDLVLTVRVDRAGGVHWIKVLVPCEWLLTEDHAIALDRANRTVKARQAQALERLQLQLF